jgi:hypothetical protein
MQPPMGDSSPAASIPAGLPFGVKGLRDWALRVSSQPGAIPPNVSQLRLYVLLRAIEVRVERHHDVQPACITGVQGVRIMRLLALMSLMPARGYAVLSPFGVRGLRDWALAVPHGAVPELHVRREGPVREAAPLTQAVPVMPIPDAPVPRLRPALGIAVCTLGALGCIAWLVVRESGWPAHERLPLRPTALARSAPVHSPSALPSPPLTAPLSPVASVMFDMDVPVPPTARPPAIAGRAAIASVHAAPVHPGIHPGAHPRAHARAHIGQRSVVVIPHATVMPRHAQDTLPDWIPDGPGVLEDYRALTSARHDAPRLGGTLVAPADPTEWSRHVTQRRVTELPDAFGP